MNAPDTLLQAQAAVVSSDDRYADLNMAPPAGRQQQVVAALKAVLPVGAILYREEDTRPYECDGLSAYRQLPMVVVLPTTEAQAIAVLDQSLGAFNRPIPSPY